MFKNRLLTLIGAAVLGAVLVAVVISMPAIPAASGGSAGGGPPPIADLVPPTPDPTFPGPTPDPTLEPTPSPTPTPTPVKSSMSLDVKGGAFNCDPVSKPTKCSAGVGKQIAVSVSVNEAPATGYVAFGTELIYDSALLAYKPAGVCLISQTLPPGGPGVCEDRTGFLLPPNGQSNVEVKWPERLIVGRGPADPDGKEGFVSHVAASGLGLVGSPAGTGSVASGFPNQKSFFEGNIINLSFRCQDVGAAKIFLSPGDADLATGSLFVTDNAFNPLDFLSGTFTPGQFDVPNIENNLTINCVDPSPTPTATATSTATATPTDTPTATPTPAKPAIVVGSEKATVGDSRSVDVEALNMPALGLGVWTLDIAYDTDIVNLTQCDADQGGVCFADFEDGVGRLTGASASGLPGNNRLGELFFSCKGVGSSTLIVTIRVLADATIGDPQDVDANAISGKFVCNPSATHTPTATNTATHTPTAAAPPPDGRSPRMSLRVYADTEKREQVCGAGAIDRKCELRDGGKFSIDVVADVGPADGYTAYAIALQFPPELTLQQQPGLDENQAKECIAGSEIKAEGRYRLSCKTGKTHYRGPLVNIHFECNPAGGTHQIDLVGGKGAGASYYVRPSIFGNLVFLKSVDKDGKAVADSVLVNCPDTGEPDPTRMPTPTPARPGSTPTPQARMSLQVYTDEKRELVCGRGEIHRECNLPQGGAFSVDVMADVPPRDGYTAYAVVLQYEDGVSLQQQPGLDENEAKECIAGSETKEEGRYRLNCKTGKTNYTGALVNVQFECGPLGGLVQIDLVGGDSVDGSYYVRPSIFGNLVFLKSELKDAKAVADSVLVRCPEPANTAQDSDQDGCADARELGGDPLLGGLRDPNDPWDFYDTPDPELPAGPPAYQRDGVVNVLDIFRVALRFGPGVASADLFSPAPATGYHPAYDRGPQVGANAWNRAPADGAINVPDDIIGVAVQFGHNCT